MTDRERGDDGLSERLQWIWDSYGDTHAPFRLLLVAKMLDRSIAGMIQRDAGLSLAQWRVLANLLRLSQSSVNALADYAQVDRAEVSRAASELAKRGLVLREIDPANRSKLRLSLTADGTAVAERTSAARRRHHAYLMEGLDDAERAQFDRLLRRLARRIEEHDETRPSLLATA